MLSGKHQRGTPTAGTRFTLNNSGRPYQDRYWQEQPFETVDQLRPIADEASMSMVQLALAWLLHNPVVTAPIIGPRTVEQLTGNLRALDITLSDETMKRLDAIWPGPGGEAPNAYAW